MNGDSLRHINLVASYCDHQDRTVSMAIADRDGIGQQIDVTLVH